MQQIGLSIGEVIAELSTYDPTGHLRIVLFSGEFGDYTNSQIATVARVQPIGGGARGDEIIGATILGVIR